MNTVTLGLYQGESIRGKTVKLKQEFIGENRSQENYLFYCQDGFGCNLGPRASGKAVVGYFVNDPNRAIFKFQRDFIESVLIN
tara:strand:- start:77 stop:325 length:249 start_codon:yes stop_codon:yes gene_type:complete